MHVTAGARSSKELGLPLAPSPRHEYSSLDVTLELVDSLEEVRACALACLPLLAPCSSERGQGPQAAGSSGKR